VRMKSNAVKTEAEIALAEGEALIVAKKRRFKKGKKGFFNELDHALTSIAFRAKEEILAGDGERPITNLIRDREE